jgi:hypothetical protein
VPEILAKAAEFRDQLRAAYEAAELMLEDVQKAFGLGPGPVKGEGRPPRHSGPQEKKP